MLNPNRAATADSSYIQGAYYCDSSSAQKGPLTCPSPIIHSIPLLGQSQVSVHLLFELGPPELLFIGPTKVYQWIKLIHLYQSYHHKQSGWTLGHGQPWLLKNLADFLMIF